MVLGKKINFNNTKKFKYLPYVRTITEKELIHTGIICKPSISFELKYRSIYAVGAHIIVAYKMYQNKPWRFGTLTTWGKNDIRFLSKEEAIDEFRSMIEYDSEYEAIAKKFGSLHIYSNEAYEWMHHTDEGENEKNKIIDERVEKFVNKIKDLKEFAKITVYDDTYDGSYIEHVFLPRLSITLHSCSNH